MESKYADIETVILDIERAALVAKDATLDRAVREEALIQFVKDTSETLIDLLDELKQLRERLEGVPAGGAQGLEKTHRVILEGYSDKSAEAALSAALDKAAHYFAEDKDVSITIQQLTELPAGGHRATLEVHITPVTLHHAAHLKGADIELKRDHDKAYHDSRTKEDVALQHLVFDHFSALTKAKTIGHIPASLLIDVSNAKLMHYMLEKQFLKAEMAHKVDELRHEKEIDSPEPEHKPHKILVRLHHDLE